LFGTVVVPDISVFRNCWVHRRVWRLFKCRHESRDGGHNGVFQILWLDAEENL